MGGSTKDIGLGVVTGGLYNVYDNQIQNIRDSKNTAKAEAKAEMDKLNAEKKKIAEMESAKEAIRVRNEQRERQRQRSVGAFGRRSTILTSPLGLVNDPQSTGQKTLLGQ